MSFIDKILGNTAQSQLKKLQPMVDKINALEGEIHALSDEALRGKTAAFKARAGPGGKSGFPASRSLRGGAGGGGAHHWPAAL